jgi:hypothetical protein
VDVLVSLVEVLEGPSVVRGIGMLMRCCNLFSGYDVVIEENLSLLVRCIGDEEGTWRKLNRQDAELLI